MRFVGLLVAACSSSTADQDTSDAQCEVKDSLVDHEMWSLVSSEKDPFLSKKKKPELCGQDDAHYWPDFGGEPAFAVTTRTCSWLTVEQPSLVAVASGDALGVRVWYFSQPTSTVAEGHIFVRLGDEELVNVTVPLPSAKGALVYETPQAAQDWPLGTPVRWHVDNKGSNEWDIIEVSVTQKGPCP